MGKLCIQNILRGNCGIVGEVWHELDKGEGCVTLIGVFQMQKCAHLEKNVEEYAIGWLLGWKVHFVCN